MAEYTPGPWRIWEGPLFEGGGADLCIGAGEQWLANMDHRVRRCQQTFELEHKQDECDICTIDADEITAEQRANANLIAAAPELLECLEWAISPHSGAGAEEWANGLAKCFDAIRKARGQAGPLTATPR